MRHLERERERQREAFVKKRLLLENVDRHLGEREEGKKRRDPVCGGAREEEEGRVGRREGKS